MFKIFSYNAAALLTYSILIENEEDAWLRYYAMRFLCYESNNFLRLTNEKTGKLLGWYGDKEQLAEFADF